MGRQRQAGEPEHHAACTARPSLLLTSHKRGSLAPRGRDMSALGSTALHHVCASESSSRPSFPSRYLARSLRVTMPTTCKEKDRAQLLTSMWSLGTRAVSCQGAPAACAWQAGTHLVAIVHNHQVPQSQGSEELEHTRQRCLLQDREGLCGLQHLQPAPIAHPRPAGVQRGPWLLPEARCRARGS